MCAAEAKATAPAATGPGQPANVPEDGSGSPLWLTTLPSGPVHLLNDGDFPGYCILYFRRHVTELYELTRAERTQLIEDLSRLAAAIADGCRPAKLNYACLGNEVPHLHWHIVPRYPTDRWWGRSFMLRSAGEKQTLPPEAYARLQQELRQRLTP